MFVDEKTFRLGGADDSMRRSNPLWKRTGNSVKTRPLIRLITKARAAKPSRMAPGNFGSMRAPTRMVGIKPAVLPSVMRLRINLEIVRIAIEQLGL
jgi:hypothetical protein